MLLKSRVNPALNLHFSPLRRHLVSSPPRFRSSTHWVLRILTIFSSRYSALPLFTLWWSFYGPDTLRYCCTWHALRAVHIALCSSSAIHVYCMEDLVFIAIMISSDAFVGLHESAFGATFSHSRKVHSGIWKNLKELNLYHKEVDWRRIVVDY